MRFLLLLVLVGVCLADYTGHRLVSINAKSKEELEMLDSMSENPMFEGLDFWTDLSTYRPIDVRVSPNDFGKFRAFLKDAGISFEVKQDNIQTLIDNERASMAKKPRNQGLCDIYSTYCTLEEIEDWLFEKQYQNSERMDLSVMNRFTSEGRNIYQVKIAKDFYNPKPAVWIEAGTHAREWIAISSALVLIDKLLDPNDPYAQTMLERFDWYIAPVHNPDGYAYSHSNDRLWRKNRQACNSIFYRGTDLNRNWDSNFGGPGSSSQCSSQTYRGTSAFSAPETAALRDAVEMTDNVVAFFSIHCYSQLMLLPYAFTTSEPAKYNELFRVAEVMMTALEFIDGRYFYTGSAAAILYEASGGAYDYFYLNGVPYSYTYELRPSSSTSNGFVLPASEIVAGTYEVFASLLAFVEDEYLDFTSEFQQK